MKFSILAFLMLASFSTWAKWSVSAYNIRNFDNDPGAGQTNLTELGKIINDFKSDVMSFEEVVNTSAFEALMKKNLPSYEYKISNCGGFGNQHLAIAYNPEKFQFVGVKEDGRFSGIADGCGSLRPVLLVSLKLKATNTVYTFGAVHLKAGASDRAYQQRWKQYGTLKTLSKELSAGNFMLMGDFNTTGFNLHDQDYQKFESYLTDSGLRTISENLSCTSYWEGAQNGREHQPSILDHIVLQDKNAASIDSVKVGAHCAKQDCRPSTPADLGISYKTVSDHCPVQVVFK